MKKALIMVCLLALCNLAMFAQIAYSTRIVHVKEKSAIHVPPQEAPAGLKKIYSNLGVSKTDLYNDYQFTPVAGPNSEFGVSEFEAIPFTPKSNSHVSQVQAALQYGSGANQVNFSIYGDTNGIPGTLLAGPVTVTNLPDIGTCCLLAIASFSPAVALIGGTRYWVVASTPLSGTGSDFYGYWANVVKPVIPSAYAINGSWFDVNANTLTAGEVLGTIP